MEFGPYAGSFRTRRLLTYHRADVKGPVPEPVYNSQNALPISPQKLSERVTILTYPRPKLVSFQ